MTYHIIRNGRTIMIGNCNDRGTLSGATINAAIREIQHRMRGKENCDDGVTYRHESAIWMMPGDVIRLKSEGQTVETVYGK